MGLSIFRGLFKKKTELSDKEKFDGAMIVAYEIAEKNPHDLHSLIKIFARKIQYDYFSEFVKLAGIYPDSNFAAPLASSALPALRATMKQSDFL